MENELTHILEKMKNVENTINQGFTPLYKDLAADYKKIINKLIAIIIIAIILLAGVFGYASFLIYKQNIKYQEFLSQFEFESEIYQDTDDNSTINSGITVNK